VEESYEVTDTKYVDIQSGENVYVTWAEDPYNFRVCVLLQLNDLIACRRRTAPLTT